MGTNRNSVVVTEMPGSTTLDAPGDTGSTTSLPDSLIADSTEQQTQTLNQDQSLDDPTNRESSKTASSSPSHPPTLSSPALFAPIKTDWKTPLDQQMKALWDSHWGESLPPLTWKIDWLTPLSKQLQVLNNNFFLVHHQHDHVVRVDANTPFDVQILRNSNRFGQEVSNGQYVEYLPDVDIGKQILRNSAVAPQDMNPDPKSATPNTNTANSDERNANAVNPSTREQCQQKTNPGAENPPDCQPSPDQNPR